MMAETSEITAQKTKPRLGFLGVGWIGKNRMEAIHKSGFSEVQSLCDFSEEVAREAASGAGNCRVVETYEDILNSGVEGVVIATPSALHAEQARMALEKGKAVFVQKPLALDATTTRELVQLAEEKDCLLHVDFSYRHTRTMQALKKVIDSGEIGEVYAADLTFHNAYGPDKGWYYDVGKAGGGCLTDLGIHLVDALYWLFPGADLSESCQKLYKQGQLLEPPQRDVEDFASANLFLSNGINARIACSWNLPAGREALIEATFYGTKGGVKFENLNGSFYEFQTSLLQGTETQVLQSPPDEWSGRTAVHWAEQLSRGNHFDPMAKGYIKVAETLDRIYSTKFYHDYEAPKNINDG